MVAEIAASAGLASATVAALGYAVPTVAGRFARPPAARAPTSRITILIPAHNEEESLPATLDSLAVVDYPPELIRVCVVADNCTDRTAEVARAAGADVLVRTDARRRGKGHALSFGLTHAATSDAVVILDADCALNPNALRAFDALFASGTEAAQAAVYSRNADADVGGFVAAAGTAFDAATAAGWDALGFSVPLRGTGMAFTRSLLDRVPWTAFGAVEDAEYAQLLRREGVQVRYCAGAEVSCAAPGSVGALVAQRRRWRGAGLLASKPLVLAGSAVAVLLGFAAGFVVWPTAVALTFAFLYARAVCTVGLSAKRLGLLMRAPLLVSRLSVVALAGALRPGAGWSRSHRVKV